MRGSMRGKVCMVTGANSGMGKVTATALARMGAHVVITCRNQAKTEQARAAIMQEAPNSEITGLWGDLSSQAQVRQLAERFKSQFSTLDVLVNNAGMLDAERTVTEDGVERTFAVNHLAPFLLTHLLLESLQRAEQGRVVTVASDVHKLAKYDPDNLQLESGYGAYKAYCLSKLANMMFSHELAKRLAGTSVTSNCCHPGYVGSNFGSGGNFLFRMLTTVSRPFLTSTDKGSRTAVYLATSPEVAGVSGEYFENQKIAKPASSFDPARTGELWNISERLVGLASAD